jgi:hypothetical protein
VLGSVDAFGRWHFGASTLAEMSSDGDAAAAVAKDVGRMEIDVLDSLADNVNNHTWAG